MTGFKYPPIEEFLPHRGTMLLLSGVVSLSETQVEVASDAAIQTWYQGPAGGMPSWIGIELMAQAVAVHVGWSKKQQGQPPKQGVLLGTRRYRAEQAEFFGALEVSARMVLMDEGGMGAYECSIASQGQLVAQATVKVFEPENFEEFLRSQREA